MVHDKASPVVFLGDLWNVGQVRCLNEKFNDVSTLGDCLNTLADCFEAEPRFVVMAIFSSGSNPPKPWACC